MNYKIKRKINAKFKLFQQKTIEIQFKFLLNAKLKMRKWHMFHFKFIYYTKEHKRVNNIRASFIWTLPYDLFLKWTKKNEWNTLFFASLSTLRHIHSQNWHIKLKFFGKFYLITKFTSSFLEIRKLSLCCLAFKL